MTGTTIFIVLAVLATCVIMVIALVVSVIFIVKILITGCHGSAISRTTADRLGLVEPGPKSPPLKSFAAYLPTLQVYDYSRRPRRGFLGYWDDRNPVVQGRIVRTENPLIKPDGEDTIIVADYVYEPKANPVQNARVTVFMKESPRISFPPFVLRRYPFCYSRTTHFWLLPQEGHSQIELTEDPSFAKNFILETPAPAAEKELRMLFEPRRCKALDAFFDHAFNAGLWRYYRKHFCGGRDTTPHIEGRDSLLAFHLYLPTREQDYEGMLEDLERLFMIFSADPDVIDYDWATRPC